MKAAILAILACIIGCGSISRADDWATPLRRQMVELDIKARGIKDERVINAMSLVPREKFVHPEIAKLAYDDKPLPLGDGQTITQPYVVAYMTEALKLKGDEKVLEIGTGSGYHSAVLAELASKIYSIEIRKRFADSAAERLKDMGYNNVSVKNADGYDGWPEHGPFDAVIITCAANHVPPPLLAQLKTGGRLVVPLGSTRYFQTLTLITKTQKGFTTEHLIDVRFVPMIGKSLEEKPKK